MNLYQAHHMVGIQFRSLSNRANNIKDYFCGIDCNVSSTRLFGFFADFSVNVYIRCCRAIESAVPLEVFAPATEQNHSFTPSKKFNSQNNLRNTEKYCLNSI